MKRLQFIFNILIILSLVFSCTRVDFDDDIPNDNGSEGKVCVRFGVTIPGAEMLSRAMGENPDIESLHLAVFDAAGYLLEYVQSDLEDTEYATENGIKYNYTAKLTPTNDVTTIHFIANGPDEGIRFGNESYVIGNLSTSDGQDAYWQRVVLDEGIQIDSDGRLSDETLAMISEVQLVRNFARVEVELKGEAAQKFTLEKIYVANTPNKGSIAVYNTDKASFLGTGQYVGKTHAQLLESGYNGFIPLDATLRSDIPAASDFIRPPYYVYERELPTENPPFIILEGTYNGLGKRYFKVDLRKNDGNYFPIFRNFIYKIIINDFMHTGKITPEAAFNGAGSGDVSSDIEYKDYTNISNGQVQLYVSSTNVYLVDGDEVIDVKYKFYTFSEGSNGNTVKTVRNELVEIAPVGKDGSAIEKYEVESEDEGDGWRVVKVHAGSLVNPSGQQTATLRFTGTATLDHNGHETEYSVYREIAFTLMGRKEITLECDDNYVKKEVGQAFDVVIGVPGGLSPYIFPLDFRVEAEKLSITPDNDNLPVETGKSIIPNKQDNSYGFVKSLGKDEYDTAEQVGQYKMIRCHFKTNKDESATKIWVANRYFNLVSADLFNYVPSQFTNLSYSVNPIPAIDGYAVNFNFTMPVIVTDNLPIEVTVTLDGLEPDDNSKLTYIGTDASDRAQYRFKPTDYTSTLKLRTTSASDKVTVILDALRYDQAWLSATRDWKYFSDLKFNNLRVGRNDATMTFKMPTSVPVKLTFEGDINNIKPVSSSSGVLTSAGEGVYNYTPNSSGDRVTQTIKLDISDAGAGDNVKVTLSAAGYSDDGASAEGTVQPNVINIRNRTISGTLSGDVNYNSNSNFSVTLSIGDQAITKSGRITRTNEGSNNRPSYKYSYSFTIDNWEVTDSSPTVKIRMRYKNTSNNYYSGECSVQDLIDGNVAGVVLTKE